MTSLNIGVQGAKRQSMRPKSPRELLKTLIERNPRSSENEIRELMRPRVKKDDDLFDPVFDYWHANNWRSLTHTPETRAARETRAQKVAAEVSKFKLKHAAIVEKEVQIILLDMVMPNGKPLRENTGRDCAKAGGLFARISKLIKPTEIVGDKLSETQIKKLCG